MFDDLVTWVAQFFGCMYQGIINFFKSCILTVYEMMTDILLMILEQFMTLSLHMLNYVSGGETPFNLQQYIDVLPTEVYNVIGLIGLDVGLGMIAVSILIRFGLQLIPFVRLGS